ncbi:MAG: DUF1003 domain-containing protein [Candidatus Palauibacterales bacterium]|nr:DUF1003 domain-containing protein [Candidatus Palauibacterales bacterium]MDP2528155.1 DUF1003 domain-containing protein [Candidatus Palauibacterales bacterium]MDP2584227.1 DUF1003 domain-containing protein [Candidatus Palauibacterales bacterium]
MSRKAREPQMCGVCGRTLPHHELVPAGALRLEIDEILRREHPEWNPEGWICLRDLNEARSRYIQSLLEDEKGELTSLEEEVLRSLQQHELLAENVEAEFDRGLTLGQRLADHIAEIGGSWGFIAAFMLALGVWIAINTVLLVHRPFDPYPFILLNLVLSCVAAIQAPVIMMSQNRQEAKDRLRGEHDYRVNLKAELEIRHLHEKVDHLLYQQWERLVEIQKVQLELMNDLTTERDRR